jgi:IS30 family transposase
MDCQDYTTMQPERKRGQHLQREDRGAIQRLKRLGYSNRAIARELSCAPNYHW